jgi:hypothetical protein
MHAYGCRFTGLSPTPDGPAAWPAVEVRFRPGAIDTGPDAIGPDHASLALEGGYRLDLDRSAATATYTHAPGEPPEPDAIVHPLLAPTGAIFARWRGREVYHAAGVLVDGRAWAVEGQPGDGKSTLVAHLASLGHPVLADDTLVVDGRTAHRGAPCVDLREESLDLLSLDGLRVGPCRGGTRQRVELPAAPFSADLAGWVFLEWSDRLDVRPMGVEALPWVVIRRTFPGLPSSERHLLDLSGLPAFLLRRPRDAPLAEVADRLLDAIA